MRLLARQAVAFLLLFLPLTVDAQPAVNALAILNPGGGAQLCQALRRYPKRGNEKLSFESASISNICQPFVHRTRASLDLCGDMRTDPYSSHFSWSTPRQMQNRGLVNIVTDQKAQPLYTQLLTRVEEIRRQTTDICCTGDARCEQAMARVDAHVCQSSATADSPDACVYGGVFEMKPFIFSELQHELFDRRKPAAAFTPISGEITLSSYLSRKAGVSSVEPVIRHEFGHACSMIKMELSASDGSPAAQEWIRGIKNRCVKTAELPKAYTEFWESVGETHEFAGCLYKLAKLNQSGSIDRPCDGLCPGHYMEEAVGITFSLLTGDLTGQAGSVFPNTCNHIRDGQHPLVSDVMECLVQNSPRFRERLASAYHCGV